MFTSDRGGASGNQNEKRQLQRSSGDELDDFLEERLQRRPEVRIINRCVVFMVYIRFGVKVMGVLALLWATVVLLGGFVSSLEKNDFWYLTAIAFIQAAGVFDAMGDARFMFLANWIEYVKRSIHSVMDFILIVVFTPVVYSAVLGPSVCILLSLFRITSGELDYGEANLKRALKLFYCLSIVHGATCLLCILIEMAADEGLVEEFSQRHGLNPEVVDGYLHQTKQMCVNNPKSIESWNLIVYGAGLLDSQLPEDYASGGRVLNMLIDQDQDIPVLITRLLIRSPRQRIQKLIETLAWRNPAEREMRWLAARIVEHLAGHLNLAHFPGSLECISSLFETSYHNNGDQEALHLPFVVGRSQQKKRRIRSMLHEMVNGVLKFRNTLFFILTGQLYVVLICLYLRTIHSYFSVPQNASTLGLDNKQRGNDDEDLLLPGLRILENLAHNRHNCTMIYNTKGLVWKIIAPVRSNELIHDIKSSAAWTKVVDGSLKVVSRLMSSSGSTSVEMRRLITYDTNAVKNLKAVLDMDMKSYSGIIQLKIRAIELLTQLALHHPASTCATVIREHIIAPMLHIFLQDWMERYLKDEKMRIEHQSSNHQNALPGPSMGARMDNLVLLASALCPLIMSVGAAQTRVMRAREARELRAAEARLSVMRAAQERLMKEAQESASQLKEKAGEALAMLSSDSEAVKSFTVQVCTEDDACRLTDLLDSNINTIKCEIGETEPVKIEINICCRISATVILKHLRNRDMKLTLEKVLAELLPIQAEASSTPQFSCSCIAAFGNDIENRAISCITSIRNDIEQCASRYSTAIRSDGVQDEPSASPSHHIQQCGERRLQAELISLVAVNLENSNFDFAAILTLPPRAPPASLLEEFVVRLKKMLEDNMYATPACLAMQKLTSKMVTGLLQHDGNVEVIDRHKIIGALLKASKVMARLECSMIFSGVDRDCHGIALKPFSSVLAENAEDLLTQRKQDLGINIGPAVAQPP